MERLWRKNNAIINFNYFSFRPMSSEDSESIRMGTETAAVAELQPPESCDFNHGVRCYSNCCILTEGLRIVIRCHV